MTLSHLIIIKQQPTIAHNAARQAMISNVAADIAVNKRPGKVVHIYTLFVPFKSPSKFWGNSTGHTIRSPPHHMGRPGNVKYQTTQQHAGRNYSRTPTSATTTRGTASYAALVLMDQDRQVGGHRLLAWYNCLFPN
jgi:hypothetical protein